MDHTNCNHVCCTNAAHSIRSIRCCHTARDHCMYLAFDGHVARHAREVARRCGADTQSHPPRRPAHGPARPWSRVHGPWSMVQPTVHGPAHGPARPAAASPAGCVARSSRCSDEARLTAAACQSRATSQARLRVRRAPDAALRTVDTPPRLLRGMRLDLATEVRSRPHGSSAVRTAATCSSP